MRTFIAINLTTEIKTKLKAATANLKALPLKIKWVEPENLHLTLKFLGNISQESLAEIKLILGNIANDYSSFLLKLEDFGFFPNSKKPRVFFLKTSSSQILENIAEQLEKDLEKIGFKKEKKFKSHITLARIKNLNNIALLTEQIKDLKITGSFKVEKISLIKSTLTKTGPIYEEIFKSNLKS